MDHAVDEVRIRIPGRAGGLGKTAVVLRIGKNPRQGVKFQDVRLVVFVEAQIDAAPVPDAEHETSPGNDVLHPGFELR